MGGVVGRDRIGSSLFERGSSKEEIVGSRKFAVGSAAQAGQCHQGSSLLGAKTAAQVGKFGQETFIVHSDQLRRRSPALRAQQELNTVEINGFLMDV
jgi:hypothetical protein